MLRAVVRIRDELASNWALSGEFSSTTGLGDHEDEEPHPTEREWAEGCGVTVLQLRRLMHEGQEARTRLVAAKRGTGSVNRKEVLLCLSQAGYRSWWRCRHNPLNAGHGSRRESRFDGSRGTF